MASVEGCTSSTGDQKKRKIEEHEADTSMSSTKAFKDFKLIEVLRADDRNKMINLHGRMSLKETSSGDDVSEKSDAVVVLERKPFHKMHVEDCMRASNCVETLQNDIYTTFDVFSESTVPDMKATLIFPATQRHIEKYSEHEPFIIQETKELYANVTLPWIESSKFSIQWVYNILDKKKEADRIVVEDPDPETGFIMVPDMKWDRTTNESLYLVAIVHKREIKSLRDLTTEHLPLLKNILKKGEEAIEREYGVCRQKLRIYFHYQPSYHHLHVHFTHIRFDAPGSDVMRAHLLSDVIENISITPDYYQRKTMTYCVRHGDALYLKFKEHGYFS